MAWRCSGATNQQLMNNLKHSGIIHSNEVYKVLSSMDRAKYCIGQPYTDAPQSIGYNATISAPHMHAMCLELLKEKLISGKKALDVGSGSGYFAVAMAKMMGEDGKVWGIEHIPELVETSLKNVQNDCPELLRQNKLSLQCRDGRLGLKEESPFDVIHVGAASSDVPHDLLNQLSLGGLLVCPIDDPSHFGQSLTVFQRTDADSFRKVVVNSVQYVPLTDRNSQLNS